MCYLSTTLRFPRVGTYAVYIHKCDSRVYRVRAVAVVHAV